MPWEHTFDLTTANNQLPVSMYFNMNSIHDPNFTDISGGQPRFHDQAALQYSVYSVLASTLTATVIASARTGPTMIVLHYPRVGEPTSMPTLGVARDLRTGMSKRDMFHPTTSAQSHITLSATYNRRRYFSGANLALINNERTVFGNNPINRAQMGVGMYNLDPTAITASKVTITVHINYRVLLLDRIEIGES